MTNTGTRPNPSYAKTNWRKREFQPRHGFTRYFPDVKRNHNDMDILIIALVVCMIIASVISVDSTRSPSYIEPGHDNKICDAVLSTKWYRLVGDAGSDLTNDSSVLVSDGCGTSYQRWMSGTVPDVSEGIVDREICLRSVFSICQSSFTIQVKNCCSFRVYHLRSATNCPQAYCVSPSLVSSVNCSQTSWDTTTTSSSSSAKTTTSTIQITGVITGSSTTAVRQETGPSGVPCVDCPHHTADNTSPVETTTSVHHDTGDQYITIVNVIDSKVLITVIVPLVAVVMTIIGISIYKSYKSRKVDTERDSTYCAPVLYRQEPPEHVYLDACIPAVAVERGGVNNRTTTYTGHGREPICNINQCGFQS
ncbi:uncharacterized protein LOC117328867 isoform X1 [Pecten maximus]|uniref:uncharacterized protein LOC117328867 isoform X1 n=1 Tax=Pecten maximus TaxID=6579 RepID=UPI001457EF35|nr:uncharacterized protein LOC117328867 isoform X1 [Pecten maximus]